MAQPAAPAAAIPAAQQHAQDALLHHDRVRRSTDLPTFHGIIGKDSISARDLIKRFENAAEIAAWATPKKKCQEFYMILRDNALVWWSTMKDYGIDVEDWDAVKAHFIKKFEPKSTAKTSCANLMELTQKPGESATLFHFRLFRIYERLCEARPAAINTVTFTPAVANAATNAELIEVKKEGIAAMEMFLKHQLFLAGLREPLRSEVMKEGKATIGEAVDFADELESIYRKNERSIAVIAEEREDDDVGDLNDEELEAVNAIRKRMGKKPFVKKNYGSGGNRTQSNGNGVQCRYCKKIGHMQRECRSRKRDRAPLVDANGKPFEKKVNAVEDTAAADVVEVVNTVESLSLNFH